MKKNIIRTLFAIALWGLIVSGTLAQTISVTDMTGRQVSAPVDPNRILCIGPGALRLIVYLDAQSKVVGVEDLEKFKPGGRPYRIAHPELAQLPRCGPGGPAAINKKPDLEAVLSVRPQLLFVTYMDGPLADEIQRITGVPTMVLNCGSFATFDETVYDALRIAAIPLNRRKRADEIVAFIESLRKDLQRRTAGATFKKQERIYVGGIGCRGAHGILSTEQNYIPFEWLGIENPAKQFRASISSHVFMDREALLALNPHTIFLDGGGLSLVVEDYHKHPDFYRSLQAFASGRVFRLLPFNWYATNLDTALADAYAVGKIIYSERFADVDPGKRADDIYTYMVGKPVYQKMKSEYGTIGQRVSF